MADKPNKPNKPNKPSAEQDTPGTKPAPEATGAEADAAPSGFWAATAGWQKLALLISVLFMAIGVVLPMMVDGAPPAVVDTDPAGSAPGTTALFSGAPPTNEQGEPAGLSDDEVWSPAVFRMGFGFFLAFAVGYALRTLMKLAVLAIGLFALALFGLDYAGVVEIRWAVMEGHSDTVGAWLGDQIASLQAFVTGYLPATATSTVGLVAGLKRK